MLLIKVLLKRNRTLSVSVKKILVIGLIAWCLVFKSVVALAASADTLRIFFDINKYELSDSDRRCVDSILDLANRHHSLFVNGYADNLDSKIFNKRLSLERAEAVRNCLFGVDSSLSIHITSVGQIKCPGDSKTEGNRFNRRVDIIFERKKTDVSEAQAPKIADIANRQRDSIRFKEKTSSLSLMDIGGRLSIDELIFRPGRHILDSSSTMYLKILTDYFKTNTTLVFEIRGHVCCTTQKDGFDVDATNYRLSENRAREIFFYFLKNGIDPHRMTVTAAGSLEPKVSPEVTEEDKKINRRVEIVILKK
jgi:outer membrane protein OmpA-like peptidoglycan-associated protein